MALSSPVAWSLCQVILAALRETERGSRREIMLEELSTTLEHLGPNVQDATPEEALRALDRCGLERIAANHLALAAARRESQNHDVVINTDGPMGQARFECSCGQRGTWKFTVAGACRSGDTHRKVNA